MLPDAPTIPELLGKLEALGDPQQIAYFFEGEGIKAKPCGSHTCAVAVYLIRETGEDLAVGELQCIVWRNGKIPNETHDLPLPVRDFISEFDDLDFPELVDWANL